MSWFSMQEWAVKEGVRLAAQMNAEDPCTCGHGKPFHQNSRRSKEMIDRLKLVDGQCSGLGCKCVRHVSREPKPDAE